MSLGLGYIIGNDGVNWKHLTVPDGMNQNYHYRKATEMSWNLLIPMWLQLTFEWCPQSWQGYVSGASPRPIIGSEDEVSLRTCLLSVSHLLRLLISTITPKIDVLSWSLSKVLWNCWEPERRNNSGFLSWGNFTPEDQPEISNFSKTWKTAPTYSSMSSSK